MDTAQYSGLKSEYTVFKGVGYYTVTDNNAANGNDGVDTLYGIEKLQFSDGLVNLGNKLPGNDFNADGKNDIIWKSSVLDHNVLSLMDGTTQIASGFLGGSSEWSIIESKSDFNGDGKSDIIWRSNVLGHNYLSLMDGTTQTASGFLGGSSEWAIQM
jgi:hypothetical protein